MNIFRIVSISSIRWSPAMVFGFAGAVLACGVITSAASLSYGDIPLCDQSVLEYVPVGNEVLSFGPARGLADGSQGKGSTGGVVSMKNVCTFAAE
jgi:hypothetical protein